MNPTPSATANKSKHLSSPIYPAAPQTPNTANAPHPRRSSAETPSQRARRAAVGRPSGNVAGPLRGVPLFGDPQLPDRDSLAFVAVPAQAGDGDPGDACVRQVLLEDVIVKRRCDRQNGRERGWPRLGWGGIR